MGTVLIGGNFWLSGRKLRIKIENTKDLCRKFDVWRKKELLLHALRGAGLSIKAPPNVGYKATLNSRLF